MKSVHLLLMILLSIPIKDVVAGDWERLLFLEGVRREAHEVEAEEKAHLQSKISRLMKVCPGNENMYCVDWKLSLSSPLQEEQARQIVEDALQVWEGADLPIQFNYVGLTEGPELPYRRNPEGEIELDDFDNPILEGPFIFSFNNPPEIQFQEDEVSVSKKYVAYDPNANVISIEWNGIFLNPRFNPMMTCTSNCLKLNGYLSYSLRSVLVFEIGRMLGLGPSGLPQSVMYPLQVPQTQKRYDFLREDDTAWVRSLYELSVQNSGRLSGKIINGRNGEPLGGAQVVVLPLDDIQSFTETVDLNLFVQSAISKAGGKFTFPALSEGSYILLAESMDGTRLVPELFDDWIKVFGTRESFEPDYYDGKTRESNAELLRYSPRAAWFAAIVHVVAGQETKDVEIITNIFDEEVNRIEAKGSSNETLSPFVPEDLTDVISKQAEDESSESGTSGGGCSLQSPKSKNSTKEHLFILLGCLITLVLRYRFQKLRALQDRLVR